MIEISFNAEYILEKYRTKHVNDNTTQEHGRSAFWLWYDKIQEQIQSLEQVNIICLHRLAWNGMFYLQ